MTEIQLPIQNVGAATVEVLPVDRDAMGRLRLRASPGMVEGLAAGDLFELDPSTPTGYRVLQRGGNLCVWIYFAADDENRAAAGERLRTEIERIGGWLDGGGAASLVFTIPVAVGFFKVEDVLNAAVSRHSGAHWRYGNVYDADGKPLRWWEIPGAGAGARVDRVLIAVFVVMLILASLAVIVAKLLDGFPLFGEMKFGRPLRIRGRQQLARIQIGDGGHDGVTPRVAGLGRLRRARCAMRWLEAARAEHASAPAFEHLAEQLTALAAPPELVDRCRAAAADEQRHARRCFALARAYVGIRWKSGAPPAPPKSVPDLQSLAVESLVDGCIGEAIAAELARRGAQRATDPVIRETLAMLAADEARHADLAREIVAFCRERGGRAIDDALRSALERPTRASSGPCEISRAEVHEIVAATRERVVTVAR